jgi:hypothetical protein
MRGLARHGKGKMNCQAGMIVADIGAGTGLFTQLFAREVSLGVLVFPALKATGHSKRKAKRLRDNRLCKGKPAVMISFPS